MPLMSPNPILLSFYVEHKKQKPESQIPKKPVSNIIQF